MSYTNVFDAKQKRHVTVDALGREKPEWRSDLDKGSPQPFRDHPRILYKAGAEKRVENPAEEAAAVKAGWGRDVDHGMTEPPQMDVIETKRGPGRPKKDAA
jgi:hypothetical protein